MSNVDSKAILHGSKGRYSMHRGLLLRGGARSFPTEGLTLPTRGLKYGFLGSLSAKNIRKIAFYLPTGG